MIPLLFIPPLPLMSQLLVSSPALFSLLRPSVISLPSSSVSSSFLFSSSSFRHFSSSPSSSSSPPLSSASSSSSEEFPHLAAAIRRSNEEKRKRSQRVFFSIAGSSLMAVGFFVYPFFYMNKHNADPNDPRNVHYNGPMAKKGNIRGAYLNSGSIDVGSDDTYYKKHAAAVNQAIAIQTQTNK